LQRRALLPRFCNPRCGSSQPLSPPSLTRSPQAPASASPPAAIAAATARITAAAAVAPRGRPSAPAEPLSGRGLGCHRHRRGRRPAGSGGPLPARAAAVAGRLFPLLRGRGGAARGGARAAGGGACGGAGGKGAGGERSWWLRWVDWVGCGVGLKLKKQQNLKQVIHSCHQPASDSLSWPAAQEVATHPSASDKTHTSRCRWQSTRTHTPTGGARSHGAPQRSPVRPTTNHQIQLQLVEAEIPDTAASMRLSGAGACTLGCLDWILHLLARHTRPNAASAVVHTTLHPSPTQQLSPTTATPPNETKRNEPQASSSATASASWARSAATSPAASARLRAC
jgi:hypothetical protein